MEVGEWLVVGLDLSVTRTGYAVYHVVSDQFTPIAVGSLKPKDTASPVWVRSLLTARSLDTRLGQADVQGILDRGAGVMLSFEAPTPKNDFLSSINRIISSVLLTRGSAVLRREVHNLYINASTLRSFMGLTMRGAKNKVENIAKAYTLIDRASFPSLDTDSCDAVLMAVVGCYAAQILGGHSEHVPPQFIRMLCDSASVVKGKGTHTRTVTKGLLHNPNYWFVHRESSHGLMHRDASLATTKAKEIISVI
jgi:hypothetical protein